MNQQAPGPPTAAVMEDYRALSQGTGFVDLSGRSRIELTGSDRSTFLHSFCTNDIHALTPGTGCEAFILDPKGKTLGHVAVFCHPDRLILDTTRGQATPLIEHLDRYIIMEDVKLEDCSDARSGLHVCGHQAHSILTELAEQDLPEALWSHCEARISGIPITCQSVAFTPQPSCLLTIPTEHFAALLASITESGLTSCQQAAWEMYRIESGWPQFGADISEDNLPQEVARDETAINFNKGCYLGQETVARLDAMGHVNRRLVCIDCKGTPVLPMETELTHGDKIVGKITSSCYSPKLAGTIALGYVQRGLASPGQPLTIGAEIAEIIQPFGS